MILYMLQILNNFITPTFKKKKKKGRKESKPEVSLQRARQTGFHPGGNNALTVSDCAKSYSIIVHLHADLKLALKTPGAQSPGSPALFQQGEKCVHTGVINSEF